jgi:hypothetical protein
MLKRLTIGVFEGLMLGVLAALVSVKLLGLTSFGGLIAYACAVVVGVLVGLVAGKPIWARDAKIEAGLKAVVGGVLGGVALWALRRWGGLHVDLSAFGAGAGRLGDLPAASLPLIATLLSVLFELDNTGDASSGAGASGSRTRVAPGAAAGALDVVDDEVQAEAPEHRARRGL